MILSWRYPSLSIAGGEAKWLQGFARFCDALRVICNLKKILTNHLCALGFCSGKFIAV